MAASRSALGHRQHRSRRASTITCRCRDWTTGDGGLDAQNWLAPAPAGHGRRSANVQRPRSVRLAIDLHYRLFEGEHRRRREVQLVLQRQHNLGIGLDPNGTDLQGVAARRAIGSPRHAIPISPTSKSWRNKQLRWWWNNAHQAIYDDGDGTGWSPHGPITEWVPQSKPIAFAEYGFPACDQRHQSAERVLQPGIGRKRDAVLVDLGPEPKHGRSILAAPRRHDCSSRRCRPSTSTG